MHTHTHTHTHTMEGIIAGSTNNKMFVCNKQQRTCEVDFIVVGVLGERGP